MQTAYLRAFVAVYVKVFKINNRLNFGGYDSKLNKLELYYNKFNEEKRLNSRHGRVEYIVTMKYVHEALETLMRENGFDSREQLNILDIGAGTGRYSVPLCEEGYSVTAVELVKYNLGILKKKNSNVKAYQGNALKLKRFEDNSFDLTLLFGPMYHLLTFDEKVKALSEAKRVTKPGGYILVAYIMNEYAFVMYAIQENMIKECLDNNMLTEDFHTVPGEDSLYDFVRVEDIDRFNDAVGLKREKIISPDGPVNYIRPFVNKLSEQDFEQIIKYQLATCERADILGAGAHTVDILRKGTD